MVRGVQKFDILPRPLPRFACEENITDDRNGISTRLNNFSRAFQSDASDGYNRLVCQGPNPANEFDSNYWVRVGLGRRGKHWPDGNVISSRSNNSFELIQAVRRNSQQFPCPDQLTGGFRPQVFLSDVNATRFRDRCDVSSVIHQ